MKQRRRKWRRVIGRKRKEKDGLIGLKEREAIRRKE
jgi:hypothetical protein